MMNQFKSVSWRFLGGSVEIDKSVDPPNDVVNEVLAARSLLFQPYPGILPNIFRQFCQAAADFDLRKRAWIDVPLRKSGYRMLAIYFVYQRSRSFWNGLEMVYEPTDENTRAVSNLMAYDPEKLWDFWQQLSRASGGAVSVQEMPGACWDGQSAALNFPLPGQDRLYTGRVPENWEEFVSSKPEPDRQPEVQEEESSTGWKKASVAVLACVVVSAVAWKISSHFFREAPVIATGAEIEEVEESAQTKAAEMGVDQQQFYTPGTQADMMELLVARRSGFAFRDAREMQRWLELKTQDAEAAEVMVKELMAQKKAFVVLQGQRYRCSVLLHTADGDFVCPEELFIEAPMSQPTD